MRLLLAAALAALAACGGGASNPAAPERIPVALATPLPVPADETWLTGSGDIGWPGTTNQKSTGEIVIDDVKRGAIPFTVGDNEQSDGSYANFMLNYDPYWNPPSFPFRHQTIAVTGNHEYESGNVNAFFTYFGAAADPDGTQKGWFIRRLPFVTVVVLNSNVSMRRDSEQLRWLTSALATEPTPCTVALWHHPRWSSGRNGDNANTQELWNTLYAVGADVVVNGHDHWYERMKPQRPDGTVDIARGLRQFTAGGGGAVLYELNKKNANSEFHKSTHGVLRLRFTRQSYGWDFIDIGRTVIDSDGGVPDAETQCH